MKILLLKDVHGVGRKGEVKEVKNGYALNVLFPRAFAQLATPAILETRAREEAERHTRSEKDRERAKMIFEKFSHEPIPIRLRARTNERGIFFGSVQARDIERELTRIGLHARVVLERPIKQPGTYTVSVESYGITGSLSISLKSE